MTDHFDTILLDLGGVLIDVDYDASVRTFKELGHPHFDRLYSKAKQDHLFDGFETGDLTPAHFRERIRELFDANLSDTEIDSCWNAMLGTIPPERIELVRALKTRYTVLLFSNTNAIHVPAFTAIVAKENGITDFKGSFDGAYYSCELGMRKPDPAAFLHVLALHEAQPSRTLFIDDSMQHVEGARKAGMHAEFLNLGKEDILGLVDRLELLL